MQCYRQNLRNYLVGLPSGEIQQMKRIALSLLAIATLAGIASPAQAIDWRQLGSFTHWNMDSLISNEQSRINAGKANGSLTPTESGRLQARLNDIMSLKNRLSRGGLNPGEQQAIDSQLDALSQDIYRESNDHQMLGSKPYGWSSNYNPNNSNWRYGHWDNGKWISKNNWNQYDGWRQKNWHNNWSNNPNAGDGQPGPGLTYGEQNSLNKQRYQLQQQANRMASDGYLSAKDRQKLDKKQRKLNQKEMRDRND